MDILTKDLESNIKGKRDNIKKLLTIAIRRSKLLTVGLNFIERVVTMLNKYFDNKSIGVGNIISVPSAVSVGVGWLLFALSFSEC